MQIVWMAKSLKSTFGDTLLPDGKERFVSFSPPLHIANLVSSPPSSTVHPLLLGGGGGVGEPC